MAFTIVFIYTENKYSSLNHFKPPNILFLTFALGSICTYLLQKVLRLPVSTVARQAIQEQFWLLKNAIIVLNTII
jgi:hypothetical protein